MGDENLYPQVVYNSILQVIDKLLILRRLLSSYITNRSIPWP